MTLYGLLIVLVRWLQFVPFPLAAFLLLIFIVTVKLVEGIKDVAVTGVELQTGMCVRERNDYHSLSLCCTHTYRVGMC